MTRWAQLLLVTACLAGCRTAPPHAPRYIVSLAPFPFLDRHPGFCVAVDPIDPKGAWWWEPGRFGCNSRSTGPTPFPAQAAEVVRTSSGVEVSFEIQLMRGEPLQVRLQVHEDRMRAAGSGRAVPAERRATLEIPELPPPIG